MMARRAAALLLCPTLCGAAAPTSYPTDGPTRSPGTIAPQTEQEVSNLEKADPPAYTLTQTTFNLMLSMAEADKAACYTDSGSGVWDRSEFRSAVREALNQIAIQQVWLDGDARDTSDPLVNDNWQSAQPYVMSADTKVTPNQWDNIKLSRVVESSKPFLSTNEAVNKTCGNNPDCMFLAQREDGTLASQLNMRNFWNVMLRVTIVDLPVEIAQNFRPFMGAFAGYTSLDGSNTGNTQSSNVATSTGTYSKRCPNTQYKFDSFWIGTEEHFVQNRLEPVSGRGRKDQALLIPLIMGLSFMLIGPAGIVFLIVSHQERLNDNAAQLSAKQAEIEKKNRDEQALDDQLAIFRATDKKSKEKKEKKDTKAKELHAYEINEGDLAWDTKSGRRQPAGKEAADAAAQPPGKFGSTAAEIDKLGDSQQV